MKLFQSKIMGFGFLVTMMVQPAAGSPICERYRSDVEGACGRGVEFFTAANKHDLLIMGAPSHHSTDDYQSAEVCFYPAAPGLISIHRVNSRCEEILNVAGNLCFREGLSIPVNLSLREIRADRQCSPRPVTKMTDPQVTKAYLWGTGLLPTEKMLLIHNKDGYFELSTNPILDTDDVNDVIRVTNSDPRFDSIREKINQIRVEYLSDQQCSLQKSMMGKLLNNINMLMADGTDPQAEVYLETGRLLQIDACTEVRGFFPIFSDIVKMMESP